MSAIARHFPGTEKPVFSPDRSQNETNPKSDVPFFGELVPEGSGKGVNGGENGAGWREVMEAFLVWSECTHPLTGVGATQSKLHFSNLSSLMRRQVLVGSRLGGPS